VLAFAGIASAATDIAGEWHVQENVFAGPDSTSQAPGTYEYGGTNDYEFLVEDQQGNFSGSTYGGQDAINGNLTGGNVLFSCANGCTNANQPLRDTYQGSLSNNGEMMSGMSADCPSVGGDPIYVGTWTANIGNSPTAPAPPMSVNVAEAAAICKETPPSGVDERHATATVTTCYRGSTLTSASTCVATVSDQDYPAGTPQGAVRFTVNGAGSLPGGSTCTLVPDTSTTGSPASCSITFQPGPAGTPANSTVPLESNYLGDNDYMPSSASSASVIVGSAPPPPNGSQPTPPEPTLFSYNECEDWAYSTSATPPGVYTGPDGADVPQIERDVYCAQVAGLSLIQGGSWALTSTAGAAILGATFSHSFGLYVAEPAGFPAAAAQYLAWSNSMYAAYQRGMDDPPASNFTKLAKPVIPRVPKVRLSGSAAQRRTAKTLNRLIGLLASSRAAAAAFTITVDRVGGAKRVRSDLWEGRQTRLAITFANQLVSDYAKLKSLTRSVAKLAAHSPGGRDGLSTVALKHLRTEIQRSGLTATERSRLRSLGYDPAQIAAVVAAARNKKVPTSAFITSPANLFASPQLTNEYQSLRLFFHLWAREPDVLAAAALG